MYIDISKDDDWFLNDFQKAFATYICSTQIMCSVFQIFYVDIKLAQAVNFQWTKRNFIVANR